MTVPFRRSPPSSLGIGLLRLLGVPNLDEFLEDSWERAPRVTRGVIDNARAEILTGDQFEILMASAATGATTGLNIIDGHVARPILADGRDSTRLAVVFDAYRRGCSLLLSAMQVRWPPISSLCREIENELIAHDVLLAEGVAANAYLTPPGSQGFDIHYDNHCAVVLQLHGAKRWTVFPPKEELPVARCEQAIVRADLGTPIVDTELVAGDVLYIPRGFPHVASTGDRSSLHLTLSVRTMTWLGVLDALCRADRAFRQSVRPLSMRGARSAQKHFDRELRPRIADLEVGDFLRRRLLESLTRLNPVPDGRLRAIDDMVTVGADTRVVRAPLVTCAASEEDGQAVLRFPGGVLRLPAAMKPVFDFVVAHAEFTARRLPRIAAAYDAEEFVRILIRKGLVRPDSTDPRHVPATKSAV